MNPELWHRIPGIRTLFTGSAIDLWLEAMLSLAVLIAIAWAANWLAKQIVLRLVPRILGRLPLGDELQRVRFIAARLSNVVPAMIIESGAAAIPHIPPGLAVAIEKLAIAFIILTLVMAASRVLTFANVLYDKRPDAASRPIKGYVQLVKIGFYGAGAILVFASLLGKSPVLVLSGLGAMAAVLMLIFKDTLLSLVASVQIGSGDMLRVGDEIVMPQLNVGGNVTDIALHTVTVRNYDKTISTIPTYRLISDSFRNWRWASKRGIWQILRSVMIDQTSVAFLDQDALASLRQLTILRPYLDEKEQEIAAWDRDHPGQTGVNGRQLTNLGTFRAYMLAYLKTIPEITDKETLVVRQLAPTENGLPLQIYAYVDRARWAEYERIQADIFDHLLAILPQFGLRLFQSPTGYDLAHWPAEPGRLRGQS